VTLADIGELASRGQKIATAHIAEVRDASISGVRIVGVLSSGGGEGEEDGSAPRLSGAGDCAPTADSA